MYEALTAVGFMIIGGFIATILYAQRQITHKR